MPQETDPKWRSGWRDHAMVLRFQFETAISKEPAGPDARGLSRAITILDGLAEPPKTTR